MGTVPIVMDNGKSTHLGPPQYYAPKQQLFLAHTNDIYLIVKIPKKHRNSYLDRLSNMINMLDRVPKANSKYQNTSQRKLDCVAICDWVQNLKEENKAISISLIRRWDQSFDIASTLSFERYEAQLSVSARELFAVFKSSRKILRMGSAKAMDIRIAHHDDMEDILYGFRTYYWPYEPLSCGHKIKSASPVEEAFFMNSAEKGFSLIATDPDRGDKVVGFLTNDILCAETLEKCRVFLKEHPEDERLHDFVGIFNKINEQVNIFDKFKVDKVMFLMCVAVDPIMRGKSIGLRLFERAFELAKENGIKVAAVDCTGVYSTQIACRLGMECVTEVAYKNYLNDNGEQIFNPPSMHTHIRRFVKEV